MRFIVTFDNGAAAPLMDVGTDEIRKLLAGRGLASVEGKNVVRDLVHHDLKNGYMIKDMVIDRYTVERWFWITQGEVQISRRLDAREKKQAMAELRAMGKLCGIWVKKENEKKEEPEEVPYAAAAVNA